MKIQRIALTAAIAFVACAIVASLVWWLSGDDEERATGACSEATYQLETERDGETLEVSFEVQSSAPGETWQVSIVQGDESLLEGERQTDEDAELDVDAFAPKDGDGEITATATQGDQTCTATING